MLRTFYFDAIKVDINLAICKTLKRWVASHHCHQFMKLMFIKMLCYFNINSISNKLPLCFYVACPFNVRI